MSLTRGQKAFLGNRAGRYDAHNLPIDDGFVPAFFRFGWRFCLLANSDGPP